MFPFGSFIFRVIFQEVQQA